MNTSAITPMPAAVAWRLARRGVMYWLLMRVALLLLSRGAVGVATPSIPAMFMAAAVAGILAHTEYLFFRERIISANLGIRGWWFAVLPALVSLSIDALLWLIFPTARIVGDVFL